VYWYDDTGALIGSVLSPGSTGITGTTEQFGVLGDNKYGMWVNGKCAQVRLWDAVLSQSEIEAELASSTIVRTANINTAFEDDPSTDVSGNSRPWSVNSVDIDAADYPPNYSTPYDSPGYDSPGYDSVGGVYDSPGTPLLIDDQTQVVLGSYGAKSFYSDGDGHLFTL